MEAFPLISLYKMPSEKPTHRYYSCLIANYSIWLYILYSFTVITRCIYSVVNYNRVK